MKEKIKEKSDFLKKSIREEEKGGAGGSEKDVIVWYYKGLAHMPIVKKVFDNAGFELKENEKEEHLAILLGVYEKFNKIFVDIIEYYSKNGHKGLAGYDFVTSKKDGSNILVLFKNLKSNEVIGVDRHGDLVFASGNEEETLIAKNKNISESKELWKKVLNML